MAHGREFHDGRHDGLTPLESLDLDRVTSFSGLLRAMSKTAFSGRSLGEALEVLLAMVRDPDCKVVLTLSGAMTIAKMGKVIAKMIDAGMVQAVVSTGALMAHGLSEAVGMVHYRHDPRVSDEELFDKGYNRVYDTLEMEANLNYVEEFSSLALDRLGHERELSSEIICRALGRGAGRGAARRRRAAQRLREEGPGLRAGLHRLGAGPRPLDLGHEARPEAGPERPARAASRTCRATTPTSTSTASRASPWARGSSASSPSAAACRATGPRRSAPTWTSPTTAWASA